MDSIADVLLCPSCGREHPPSERFCASCGMPLVHPAGASGAAPGAPGERRREQARKIKPQYSEGRLVKVAYAQNQPEAELIQGLLLEEGIPSMARRAPGFDVPDFLAAGPRHILVPESGVAAARKLSRPPPRTRTGQIRAPQTRTGVSDQEDQRDRRLDQDRRPADQRTGAPAWGRRRLAGPAPQTRTGWPASLVIASISSLARSNSASDSTGVPSNGSSRWSSTQAWEALYSSLTFTVTGRGMR